MLYMNTLFVKVQLPSRHTFRKGSQPASSNPSLKCQTRQVISVVKEKRIFSSLNLKSKIYNKTRLNEIVHSQTFDKYLKLSRKKNKKNMVLYRFRIKVP